jgi:hypothetical protein
MGLRIKATVGLLALVGGLLGTVPAGAGHNNDDHSKNVKLLARKPIVVNKETRGEGSDLAFRGRRMYAGTYQGTALYEIVGAKDGHIKQIGFHDCPGSQGDVSVVGSFVFVSIDSPGSNNGKSAVCNNTKTTGFHKSESSEGKEGIRVVDFRDPRHPKQVAFVETKCGSHTHTLVPDGAKTYMYIESYPISQAVDCNAVEGHGAVSILSFPTSNPAKLKFESFFDVSRTPLPNDAPIGCHDLQAWPERDLVIAACITEAQVWNIKNPAKPEILARIVNPDVQVWHSAAFTWDGKYAIISDEYAGAAGGGGCTGDKDSTVGAMWFYDVTDPASPENVGHYSLPRVPPVDSFDELERFRCTTHIYTILPMKDPKKYVAVSSFYSGGISAVDFSDPANPKEIGHYLMQPRGINPDSWSAYWYNGRVYTNDHASLLGVGVFKVRGLEEDNVLYYKRTLNPQTQIKASLHDAAR